MDYTLLCDNPNCGEKLGELACGNQTDNGMYCSAKCAEVGKKKRNIFAELKALQEENECLKQEVEKYKRYWKDSDERNVQYVEYKNAFQCLLKELGIKKIK